jgi:Leucine-rich repeat (LRR) protein
MKHIERTKAITCIGPLRFLTCALLLTFFSACGDSSNDRKIANPLAVEEPDSLATTLPDSSALPNTTTSPTPPDATTSSPPLPEFQAHLLDGDFTLSSQETLDALLDSIAPLKDSAFAIGGNLTIHDAPFANLERLEGLTQIRGDLSISDNSSLSSLQGLNQLSHIDGKLYIEGNSALVSLDGLDSVETVEGDIAIENNGLLSLEGLARLKTAHANLRIKNNPQLTALFEDKTDSITIHKNLSISGNGALTTLAGLEKISTIGRDLYITENPSLASLTGFSDHLVIVQKLVVRANPLLPYDTILNFIDSLKFTGRAEIEDNGYMVPSDRITFVDKRLEEKIQYAINEKDRNLTKNDVNKLTEFWGYDSMKNLTGIEHFTALTRLEFRDSDFDDISPLSNLTQLTLLDLYRCQITDISPLANLTNLYELDLQRNQIRDISALLNMTELRRLFLRNNLIHDVSPLFGLIKLTYLDLQTNSIEDISPLKNMIRLTDLLISQNQIADITPLTDMVWLKELKLESNRIEDIGPLAKKIRLEQLYLSTNQIKDLSSLSQLKGLHRLHLADNQIEDLSPLNQLEELQILILANNQIKDLSPLIQLQGLNRLDLSNNQISDITPLADLSMEYYDNYGDNPVLNLANNQISDITPLLKKKNPTPRSIDLRGNPLNLEAYRSHLLTLATQEDQVRYDIVEFHLADFTGEIIDADDRPLAGVTVELRRVGEQPDEKNPIDQSITDGNGRYSFAILNWGTYLIVPRLEGYSFSPSFLVGNLGDDQKNILPSIKADTDGSSSTSPPQTLTITTPTGSTHEMVLIPAGEFIMGADETERTVYLDSFYLDRYEVTNGQWDASGLGHHYDIPHRSEPNYPAIGPSDQPVHGVPKGLGNSYCAWAGLHLPSEEEWEKAARGTDGRPYPWGWDENGEDLSPYGVYDTVGSLREWTASQFYPPGECCGENVIKGWNGDSPATTWDRKPGDGYITAGFRCALPAAAVWEQ